MTFDIDADPYPPTDVRSFIPNWVVDQMPDATETEVAHEYAYHLIGAMQNPSRMETVRRHLTNDFRFVRRLSQLLPEVFDEVLCAYAERALTFDQNDADDGASVASAEQVQTDVEKRKKTKGDFNDF